MGPLEFYLLTIATFICVNGIAALGFNLQIGHAGIINLGILLSVAVGAYMTTIAAVPPAAGGGYTQYIGGFQWGFPWDVLFGVACAGALTWVLGLVVLPRLSHEYLALSLVAVLSGMQVFVNDFKPLFNGATGVFNVPGPWDQQLSLEAYQFVFLGVAVIALVISYVLVQRVSASPLGRAIRAVRDDEEAAASLGLTPWKIKMVPFVLGGSLAGLSGSLLALYTTGWSPGAWLTGETLPILAAVIIGGRGRNIGAVAGAAFFAVIVQGSTFFPQIGSVGFLAPLQEGVMGMLVLLVLWFRPEGVLPEKKDRFAPASELPNPEDVSNTMRLALDGGTPELDDRGTVP